MNPLNILRGFDTELYDYFEKELEHQHYSLSFIPDENSISPLCSAMMGNVLINSSHNTIFQFNASLEDITAKRICDLFNCEHANVRTITIEAASRVVFQALTNRGDTVMSLDLRKKEHCNSEAFVYHFVNFGLDPETQCLDYEALEKQVRETKPRLIILSPINYPRNIDYERVAQLAQEVNAIFWCDISQVAGLIASGVMPSPVAHADVVTFTAHGALQGPQCSVIMCKERFASLIDRCAISSGHSGLRTAELAALCARLYEIKTLEYNKYCLSVVEHAKKLAEGLNDGGVSLISGGTDSHLVVVNGSKFGLSARGALESLAECGVMVKSCQVQTADVNVKFDALRFSTMPTTSRGLDTNKYYDLGVAIAKFLISPSIENQENLALLVRNITISLPLVSVNWLTESVKQNLVEANYLSLPSDTAAIYDSIHETRMQKVIHNLKARRTRKFMNKLEEQHKSE